MVAFMPLRTCEENGDDQVDVGATVCGEALKSAGDGDNGGADALAEEWAELNTDRVVFGFRRSGFDSVPKYSVSTSAP